MSYTQLERINKIKTNLILKQPFFGVLLSQIDVKEEKYFPTMATDGRKIYFNSDWVSEISDQELLGVMMHEILHLIYMHCDLKRVGGRSHTLWNIAADYVVNYEVINMDYKLPEDGFYNKKYADMTVEEVYREIEKNVKCPKCGKSLLKQKQKPENQPGGNQPGNQSGNQPGGNQSGNQPQPSDHGGDGCCPHCKTKLIDTHIINAGDLTEVKEKILASHEASKEQGKLPAGVERMIKEIRQAKVKWQRVFQRYIGVAVAKDDYSFTMPNRRFVYDDLFLPSLRSYKIGNIVVAIDTSGSIGGDDLTQFVSEIKKISAYVDEITLMTCDASVHEVVKLYKLEDMIGKIKFKGGGGTDFNPVFDKVQEMKIQPELLIYLTDTYGSFPNKAPKYPVLWVSTESGTKVPWGDLVHMQ